MVVIRTILLVVLIQHFTFFQISAHPGEKCSTRIAELYPRQLLSLDRLIGEWYIIKVARANETLVEPPPYSCMSQVLSKQPDSDNLNIRVKLNVTATGEYVERDGQVNLTLSEPGIWRWSYFDNPVQYWDGVVIATDHETYWVHYECEEMNNYRYESAVIRFRARRMGPGETKAYSSLVEGLGFPLSNLVEIPHNNCRY